MSPTPFTDEDYIAALTRSQVRVWAGELTDDDRQAAYNRLVSGDMSTIRTRFPNGVPPFVPMDVEPSKYTCDPDGLGTLTQHGTDRPLRLYTLEIQHGPETYTQSVHALNLPSAMILALDTVKTIAEWEGSPDSMRLSEADKTFTVTDQAEREHVWTALDDYQRDYPEVREAILPLIERLKRTFTWARD